MTGHEYEKSVVAIICWKQMRGELYPGMIRLAMMLSNRAKSGWYDGSIYNNALAFSREMKMEWEDFPDAREPQFSDLLRVIDGVFTDTVIDHTHGATYCAHISASDSIAGEITAKIGQFIFFKESK